MKLRSGKILFPVTFKQKREQISGESKITAKTIASQQVIHQERLKELKAFFNSLFYHCCKNLGYKEWIDEIEQTKGRKITVDELVSWKADEHFWKENFEKTWLRMQSELPMATLLQAFDLFVNYEYSLLAENPESAMLKPRVRNRLSDLYYQSSSAKMLELMLEQNQIDIDFSKKTYLQELASDLASKIVNLLFNKPCMLTWDSFFKSSKSSCCFVPIEGGRTVIRSMLTSCNFAMGSVPDYYFKVVETQEHFKSPERDPKKAFLLHRKRELPMFCTSQPKQEH